MNTILTSVSDFFSLFSNRELAVYTWLLIFVIYICYNPKIRKDISGLLKQIFSFTILFPYFLMLIYSGVLVYLLYVLGFWTKELLKDSIMWMLVVGVSMYKTAHDATKDVFAISSIIKDTLTATVVLEFIIGNFVFSYPIELIFTLIMTVLVMLQLVSKMDEKYIRVSVFLDRLIKVIGLCLIIYVVYRFSKEYRTFMDTQNQKTFWLPIFLSFGIIPFVYCLALFMVYQDFFVRIGHRYQKNPVMAKYIKFKALKTAFLNLVKVRILSKELKIYMLSNQEEVDDAIKNLF